MFEFNLEYLLGVESFVRYRQELAKITFVDSAETVTQKLQTIESNIAAEIAYLKSMQYQQAWQALKPQLDEAIKLRETFSESLRNKIEIIDKNTTPKALKEIIEVTKEVFHDTIKGRFPEIGIANPAAYYNITLEEMKRFAPELFQHKFTAEQIKIIRNIYNIRNTIQSLQIGINRAKQAGSSDVVFQANYEVGYPEAVKHKIDFASTSVDVAGRILTELNAINKTQTAVNQKVLDQFGHHLESITRPDFIGEMTWQGICREHFLKNIDAGIRNIPPHINTMYEEHGKLHEALQKKHAILFEDVKTLQNRADSLAKEGRLLQDKAHEAYVEMVDSLPIKPDLAAQEILRHSFGMDTAIKEVLAAHHGTAKSLELYNQYIAAKEAYLQAATQQNMVNEVIACRQQLNNPDGALNLELFRKLWVQKNIVDTSINVSKYQAPTQLRSHTHALFELYEAAIKLPTEDVARIYEAIKQGTEWEKGPESIFKKHYHTNEMPKFQTKYNEVVANYKNVKETVGKLQPIDPLMVEYQAGLEILETIRQYQEGVKSLERATSQIIHQGNNYSLQQVKDVFTHEALRQELIEVHEAYMQPFEIEHGLHAKNTAGLVAKIQDIKLEQAHVKAKLAEYITGLEAALKKRNVTFSSLKDCQTYAELIYKAKQGIALVEAKTDSIFFLFKNETTAQAISDIFERISEAQQTLAELELEYDLTFKKLEIIGKSKTFGEKNKALIDVVDQERTAVPERIDTAKEIRKTIENLKFAEFEQALAKETPAIQQAFGEAISKLYQGIEGSAEAFYKVLDTFQNKTIVATYKTKLDAYVYCLERMTEMNGLFKESDKTFGHKRFIQQYAEWCKTNLQETLLTKHHTNLNDLLLRHCSGDNIALEIEAMREVIARYRQNMGVMQTFTKDLHIPFQHGDISVGLVHNFLRDHFNSFQEVYYEIIRNEIARCVRSGGKISIEHRMRIHAFELHPDELAGKVDSNFLKTYRTLWERVSLLKAIGENVHIEGVRADIISFYMEYTKFGAFPSEKIQGILKHYDSQNGENISEARTAWDVFSRIIRQKINSLRQQFKSTLVKEGKKIEVIDVGSIKKQIQTSVTTGEITQTQAVVKTLYLNQLLKWVQFLQAEKLLNEGQLEAIKTDNQSLYDQLEGAKKQLTLEKETLLREVAKSQQDSITGEMFKNWEADTKDIEIVGKQVEEVAALERNFNQQLQAAKLEGTSPSIVELEKKIAELRKKQRPQQEILEVQELLKTKTALEQAKTSLEQAKTTLNNMDKILQEKGFIPDVARTVKRGIYLNSTFALPADNWGQVVKDVREIIIPDTIRAVEAATEWAGEQVGPSFRVASHFCMGFIVVSEVTHVGELVVKEKYAEAAYDGGRFVVTFAALMPQTWYALGLPTVGRTVARITPVLVPFVVYYTASDMPEFTDRMAKIGANTSYGQAYIHYDDDPWYVTYLIKEPLLIPARACAYPFQKIQEYGTPLAKEVDFFLTKNGVMGLGRDEALYFPEIFFKMMQLTPLEGGVNAFIDEQLQAIKLVVDQAKREGHEPSLVFGIERRLIRNLLDIVIPQLNYYYDVDQYVVDGEGQLQKISYSYDALIDLILSGDINIKDMLLLKEEDGEVYIRHALQPLIRNEKDYLQNDWSCVAKETIALLSQSSGRKTFFAPARNCYPIVSDSQENFFDFKAVQEYLKGFPRRDGIALQILSYQWYRLEKYCSPLTPYCKKPDEALTGVVQKWKQLRNTLMAFTKNVSSQQVIEFQYLENGVVMPKAYHHPYALLQEGDKRANDYFIMPSTSRGNYDLIKFDGTTHKANLTTPQINAEVKTLLAGCSRFYTLANAEQDAFLNRVYYEINYRHGAVTQFQTTTLQGADLNETLFLERNEDTWQTYNFVTRDVLTAESIDEMSALISSDYAGYRLLMQPELVEDLSQEYSLVVEVDKNGFRGISSYNYLNLLGGQRRETNILVKEAQSYALYSSEGKKLYSNPRFTHIEDYLKQKAKPIYVITKNSQENFERIANDIMLEESCGARYKKDEEIFFQIKEQTIFARNDKQRRLHKISIAQDQSFDYASYKTNVNQYNLFPSAKIAMANK